ncbi:hypothetical protein EJB05_38824, partial [Eragrostis curvula]
MAGGWRKAWLSVLGRGGGSGSTGSLQAHLQGHGHHLSPSSSSSSLASSYRPRGGKHGGGKVLVGCFAAALALAFFYVSVVTGGPGAADGSFPSTSSSPASSSSALLLSWLTSSSSTAAAAGKSIPPRPPIPPAVTASDQQRSDAAMVSRSVQSGEADDSSAAEGGSGQTADAQGPPPLQDAEKYITVGSDAEPVGNGTRENVETAMPMQMSRRTDGANSSRTAVVGAPGDLAGDTDVAAGGNSTDAKAPSRQETITKNVAIDNNAQNATRQAALPPSPPPDRKEDMHRRKRAARRRHARRRKDTVLPAAAAAAQEATAISDGVNATSTAVVSRNDMMAGVNASVAGDNRVVWTSGVQDMVSFAKCDVFNGRWVRDENYGFYPPKSCPHIDDDFNCHKNGRPDSDFLKWRWQPHGCDIPRLDATEFLERLRGQRIIFVGDSLNRNMWESLVCTLRHGVRDKRNVYEASGRNRFKTRGYYSFKFREYNCSVDFIRSTFLVKEVTHGRKNGTEDEKLRLDELDAATPAYQTANIVVFNTGHWWTHAKTSKGLNYYQEGNHVYPRLEVLDAYKKALTTWARWVDKNIDPRRTQVVFRGYSLEHFRGGLWNSGGRCHREMEPIFNQTYLTEYPEKMIVLEQVLRQMKTPVIYLNISRLTDYRKDGHPSVYRIRYETEEERMAAVTKQDCSHWCLPGVPDTWNELLYASLLQAGKGSWKL